jgi:Cd2+/Zn2+-exporting ATPase
MVTQHGLGIHGTMTDGRRVWAGSEAFAARRGIAVDDTLGLDLARRAGAGETVVLTGEGERITGVIALADEPRAGAAATVRALRRLGCAPIVMVTGDQPAVARGLAERLALDEAQAGLLPDEKLRVIRQLGDRAGPVAMVGDGVNDGPALAAASVGVTLGMASDVALEVADVVLVTNDLTGLPYAIRLSRKAVRVVAQNLAFAAAVILTGIPLALFGIVSLPIGVVMHEGSTLIVVANGLRLLRRLPADPA